MGSIRPFIKLSDKAKSITELYPTPESFLSSYFELNPIEQKSFLSHFLIDNGPFIFKNIPLLYQQIIQYFAQELELDKADVRLIGSAKTGFSISPNAHFGKPLSDKSDLDFTIFNKLLFSKLKKEFEEWQKLYEAGKITPTNYEKKYWDDNLIVVKRNIKRGFIDTKKIPNREPFLLTKRINNILFLIPFKLKEFHGIVSSYASLRVYNNEYSFLNQLKLNTEHVLKKVTQQQL